MAMSTRSRTGARPAAPPAPTPARATIAKKRGSRPASSQPAPSAAQDPSTLAKTLPDISLLSDDGHQCRLHSFFTQTSPGLILFTYPRANTSGCTAQASGLSALVDQAASAGYNIVGASYDAVKSQAAWKAKLSLKCTLLCDTLDIGLLKKIGAHKAPKSVKRSVFIVRKGFSSDNPEDPVIVESRIVISPKDCITFVEEYIRNNPVVKSDDKDASVPPPIAEQLNENAKEVVEEKVDKDDAEKKDPIPEDTVAHENVPEAGKDDDQMDN